MPQGVLSIKQRVGSQRAEGDGAIKGWRIAENILPMRQLNRGIDTHLGESLSRRGDVESRYVARALMQAA